LLGQREEISERPNQIRTLREIGLHISGTDRRVQFKNAIGELFNPHVLPTWKRAAHSASSSKAGIIAPRMGHWEAIFLFFIFLFLRIFADKLFARDQLEKGHPTAG
jgi:hypothetical protein